MTNNEAIITLKANYPDACFEQLREAVDAAIEALKAQEVSNNSPELDSDSDDTISRQTILDALDEIESEVADGEGFLYEKWREYFCDLPSAQPDSKELSGTHKALDTVSRQAAIEAHYEYCNKHPDAGFPVWSLKILEDLPTAQPEVLACGEGELIAQPERTGRWIDHVEDGYVECPFCHSATNCDDNISELHFCFSCGARMEDKG